MGTFPGPLTFIPPGSTEFQVDQAEEHEECRLWGLPAQVQRLALSPAPHPHPPARLFNP